MKCFFKEWQKLMKNKKLLTQIKRAETKYQIQLISKTFN